VKRQHIVYVVCVKDVCMVKWGIVSASLVYLFFIFFLKCHCHSSAFSDCREGYKEGMNQE